MLFFQNSAAEKSDHALNQVHADWMMKEPELREHDFGLRICLFNCKIKILNITLLNRNLFVPPTSYFKNTFLCVFYPSVVLYSYYTLK